MYQDQCINFVVDCSWWKSKAKQTNSKILNVWSSAYLIQIMSNERNAYRKSLEGDAVRQCYLINAIFVLQWKCYFILKVMVKQLYLRKSYDYKDVPALLNFILNWRISKFHSAIGNFKKQCSSLIFLTVFSRNFDYTYDMYRNVTTPERCSVGLSHFK